VPNATVVDALLVTAYRRNRQFRDDPCALHLAACGPGLKETPIAVTGRRETKGRSA